MLDEATRLTSSEGAVHERYLALFQLIEERDKELGRAFNDLRRSTAITQLLIIHSLGVITDPELASWGQT